jgi:hypothetical protein
MSQSKTERQFLRRLIFYIRSESLMATKVDNIYSGYQRYRLVKNYRDFTTDATLRVR